MKNLAQINLFEGEGFRGFGPLGLEGGVSDGSGAPSVFTNFLSSAIGVITVVAFVWFLFIIITGAIGIIGSGGDKAALEGAKKKISSGLVGLIVLIVGVFLVNIIGTIFGIESILNPAELIDQIQIK